MLFRHYILTIFVLSIFIPADTFAAEFTDLADAADDFDDLVDETFDGFDFILEPNLTAFFGSSVVTREAVCVPSSADLVGDAATNFEQNNPRLSIDPERCAEPRVIDNLETQVDTTKLKLDFALKFGLYKDLQVQINVPYVLLESHKYRYADGVDGSNSSIAPSEARISNDTSGDFSTYRFFDLSSTTREFKRSGFSDPTIGIHWAPFNDERDDTKATLLIGMDYRMPISPIKRAENDAVGEGMHELHWKVAASKKFDWIEPYFGLEYYLPISATDSPIQEVDPSNSGQVFKQAPQRGDITIGTEFIPFEEPLKGVKYTIDLQFKFGYTSDGRDYSPLFDAFGKSSCNGKRLSELQAGGSSPECAWIAQQPSNAPLRGGKPSPLYDLSDAQSDPQFNFDGITTTESYGSFAGKIGFTAQPSKYFQLRGNVALTHHQDHFITNSRTGKDLENSQEESPDNTVDLSGADASKEKNPVFNPTYDGNGSRFRVQEFNIWTVGVSAAFKF